MNIVTDGVLMDDIEDTSLKFHSCYEYSMNDVPSDKHTVWDLENGYRNSKLSHSRNDDLNRSFMVLTVVF